MKTLIYYTTVLLVFAGLFLACEEEKYTEAFSNTPKGFVEFQYLDSILVGGVLRPRSPYAYKRVNLSHAAFSVRSAQTLPDTVKGFQLVELFISSDSTGYGQAQQAIGSTTIRISLADSLFHPENPELNLAYSYTTDSLKGFTAKPNALKRPSCIGLVGKMELNPDLTYKQTFSGEYGKKVNVLYLGNGMYQVTANGLSRVKIKTTTYSFLYNLYYLGQLRRKADYVTP